MEIICWRPAKGAVERNSERCRPQKEHGRSKGGQEIKSKIVEEKLETWCGHWPWPKTLVDKGQVPNVV